MRIALLIALAATGCSVTNMLAGPSDFYSNHYEELIICSIDTAIEDEIHRRLPSGYLTRKYSPELWQEYWNLRLKALGVESAYEREHGYSGPTNEELARYILASRSKFHLPKIVPEAQTEEFVRDLYSTLSKESVDPCDFIRASYDCSLSPAQYDTPRILNRGCGA